MKNFVSRLIFTLIFSALVTTNYFAQAPRTMNAAEIKLALNKLDKVCSVLYIAAHPDDENNAVLAYLSNETLCRTGYLSLTRGEGGQNLLGSEKGAALGVIRTQELLAARRIDGAEQFFTRAVDFGFSKTSEETLRLWNKQEVLSDVVFTIRKFRPDVMITRFPPDERAGHGHHQASAILAAEAFKLAGDKNAFPEQLKYVEVWQPKRLVWNAFVRENDAPPTDSIKVDVGKYNPLLGKSYTEIAAEARSMHKTQGFGSGAVRGSRIEYFQHVAGEKAANDLFDGIDTSWKRIEGGEKIGKMIDEANAKFDFENPSKILPNLFEIGRSFENFYFVNLVPIDKTKRIELAQITKFCSGLWLESTTTIPFASPNEVVKFDNVGINRSDNNLKLAIATNYKYFPSFVPPLKGFINDPTKYNEESVSSNGAFKKSESLTLTDVEISQPFWLREKNDGFISKFPFSKNSKSELQVPDVDLPETPPSLITYLGVLPSTSNRLFIEIPVQYKYVDRVRGEIYQPFVIAPNLTANLSENVFVFADDKPKTVRVNLKAFAPTVKGKISVKLPQGFTSDKTEFAVDLKKGNEQTIEFKVQSSKFKVQTESTKFELEFQSENSDKREPLKQFVSIDYEHIPRQVIFPDASAKLVKVDLKRGNERIGYVQGSGDEIPESLRQIGYDVKLLSDEDLQNADLSANYDTIIIGIRAYNVRETLKRKNSRVLDFVKNGGNVIVQYNTVDETLLQNFAPFPLKLSRDRITDENSPVKFLDDKNAVLNSPNKITLQDFKGWTQERGTYFAGEYSKDYTPILQMNDPNEKDLNGGLLIANYGKGKFVYSGLAFFRQLPNGNVGAFRLFVNLVSSRKSSEK